MPGPIVLAQRFRRAQTKPSPFYPVRFLWEGWDGSMWDLSSDLEPGAYLRPGVRGMEMPPPRHYTRSSPALPGSQWQGNTFGERDVFWPLRMWEESSAEFLATRKAFMRTLDPTKTGLWHVIQPNGDSRTLRCRFAGFDTVPESDPVEAGDGSYGIRLVAEDVFWRGETLSPSWGVGNPQEFFVPGPSEDVFYISSSSSVATAVFKNTGDVEAFPRWTVTGETTSAVLGFGGKAINIGFTIPAGQDLVVETHPGAQSAFLNGVNVTKQLGSAAKFAPVPAGEEIDLALALTGTGRVTLEITPLFYEAY